MPEISWKYFSEDPRFSIRKASVDAEISYSLCRDILLKDLQLKPYKYKSAHQLLSNDYEKRVIFMVADLEKDAHKWFIATDVLPGWVDQQAK